MDKNARNFILDNILSMTAYWLCSGSVVASLTSYYDMPMALSNLVTGFTSTLLVLQLLGGFFYTRTKKRFVFLRFTNSIWRLFLPIVFFSVLLPKSTGSVVMFIAYFLSIGFFQLACPSQTDWTVNAVDDTVNRNFFSVREMCFMFAFSFVFAIGSLILDWATKAQQLHTGFILMGGFVLILLVASVIVLWKLPAPAPVVSAEHTPHVPVHQIFKEPFQNKPFVHLLAGNMMWSFSSMLIGSFAAIYQIRVLEIDFFSIMLWSTVANLLRCFAAPLMANIAFDTSWRFVTAVCTFTLGLSAAGWFFVTPDNMWFLFPFLVIIGSIPFAGMGVGFLKMQVELTPAATRSMYFSVNATCNGVASFTGSLLCSSLIAGIEHYWGAGQLQWIFLFGFVGACIAALIIFRVQSNVT